MAVLLDYAGSYKKLTFLGLFLSALAMVMGMIPYICIWQLLRDLIAVSKVDDGIVQVSAPLLAALLYDNFQVNTCFAIIAIVDLVSFVLQIMIHPKYETKHDVASRSSIWEDFKQGLLIIGHDPFLKGFIKVMPLANAFFGATFAVSVAYLIRQTFAIDTWLYSLYCSITSAVSMIVPLFAIKLVQKYPTNKLFFAATLSIAFCILMIASLLYAGSVVFCQ